MKLLILVLFSSLCFGQVDQSVGCKISLLSSMNLKGLTGGKVGMFKGRLTCKNYSINDVPITGPDFDLSIPTVNTVSSSDASALLNKTYFNQFGQRIDGDIGAAEGLLGGIVSVGKVAISSTTIGTIVSIAEGIRKYILPRFNVGQSPLDLTNQCDLIGTTGDAVLKAGKTMTCTVYIQKPPKGAALLPSVITFDLAVVAPPIFQPQPPIPPVMLKRPERRTELKQEYKPLLDSNYTVAISNETNLALQGTHGGEWKALKPNNNELASR